MRPPSDSSSRRARTGTPVLHAEHGELTFSFGDGTVQSRTLEADPTWLVLEYTRLMMGFLLLHPAPERVAMIGLGGGSLVRYFARLLPDVDLTTIEIAPEVIALRDRFGIPPDGPRFRILCEDGNAFVRRDGPPLDVLLVDGFDREGQPEELCSAAFYDACRERLAPDGLLVVNLHAEDAAHVARIGRIRDAFAGRIVAIEADNSENEIVFASARSPFPPPFGVLVERLRALDATHPVGLDAILRKIAQRGERRPASTRRR